MTVAEEKAACRTRALARRDALTAPERRAKSLAICRALESLELLHHAKTVLGYAAFGSECELSPFYDTLRAKGVRLAFPLAGSGGRMEAYIPCGALRPGRFGVPEPEVQNAVLVAPEELNAVLVPCVAFDFELGRLGHGKGYYDRYLSRCPQAAAILTAFEVQRLPSIPREAHDLSFSILATEDGIYYK